MYFRLGIDLVDLNVLLDLQSPLGLDLISGEIISEDIDLPFTFSMDIDTDDEGNLEEPRLYAYFPDASVMHKDLVGTLVSAGADNLQIFPTQITNASTGETINDYLVVNVVGSVACADMDASVSTPIADVYYFEELVLDPKKTQGLLVFRLADSPMELIVHNKIAQAIIEGNFAGVVLDALQERN